MGYYYQFKSKEIKLKRDTPKEVIEFLNSYINEKNFDFPTPAHELFSMKRWGSVFGKWAWYDSPFTYFKNVNGNWILFIHCDVNYDLEVIKKFAEWITPYVAGHKPKEYIGWWKGEDDRTLTNLYIERNSSNDR